MSFVLHISELRAPDRCRVGGLDCVDGFLGIVTGQKRGGA